jgi:hypothetical protein
LPQGLETSASGICPELVNALSPHGLILRGGFNFGADESVPSVLSGAPAKSALLVGQAGSAPWPHFLRWLETQPAGLKDPLDTWSRQIIGEVAQDFGARAISPSDKPYLPFQQWAMRAEGLRPSPLGILMLRNTVSGMPIAARCCSRPNLPSRDLRNRFIFAIYVSENLA